MISSVLKRRTSLDTFLAAVDTDVTSILGEVENVYGEPELIIATGSVIMGFGTPESDVDIMVVVDRENLSDLPIMSYPGKAKVDIEYVGRADILRQFELIFDRQWPLAQGCRESDWRAMYRALRTLTRLEHGSILAIHSDWPKMIERLKGDAFRTRVAGWWYTEAIRLRAAAHWLRAEDELLACVRLQDAILSALSGRTAEAGASIMSKKWLAEKLRLVGDTSGLEMLQKTLAYDFQPISKGFDELAACLTSLIPSTMDEACRLELRAASGFELIDLKEEVLFSRWGMRGTVFAGRLHDMLPHYLESDVLWSGTVAELPSPVVLELFRNDMLWLGVAGKASGEKGN